MLGEFYRPIRRSRCGVAVPVIRPEPSRNVVLPLLSVVAVPVIRPGAIMSLRIGRNVGALDAGDGVGRVKR